jgi:hypothetical protein
MLAGIIGIENVKFLFVFEKVTDRSTDDLLSISEYFGTKRTSSKLIDSSKKYCELRIFNLEMELPKIAYQDNIEMFLRMFCYLLRILQEDRSKQHDSKDSARTWSSWSFYFEA